MAGDPYRRMRGSFTGAKWEPMDTRSAANGVLKALLSPSVGPATIFLETMRGWRTAVWAQAGRLWPALTSTKDALSPRAHIPGYAATYSWWSTLIRIRPLS